MNNVKIEENLYIKMKPFLKEEEIKKQVIYEIKENNYILGFQIE